MKDLEKFYSEHYSADRMKLVIQVKKDNMKDIRLTVERAFGGIKDQNLGPQDFKNELSKKMDEPSMNKLLKGEKVE